VARDEGMQITGVWTGPHASELLDAVRPHARDVDGVEIQMAATLEPGADYLRAVSALQGLGVPVTIAPLLATERVRGKFHARTRIGYRATEIPAVDAHLREEGVSVDRILCCIDDTESPWQSIQEFGKLLPLGQVRHLDFLCAVCGDPTAQVNRAAEALFAAALVPGCRVFLDPLTELDRTSDTSPGLLDRLSNPGHAFHSVRCLNTLLFGTPAQYTPLAAHRLGAWRVLGLRGKPREWRLLLPDHSAAAASSATSAFGGVAPGRGEVLCIDLRGAASRVATATEGSLQDTLASLRGPVLLMADDEGCDPGPTGPRKT